MRNGVCGQVDATCWNGELINDVVKGRLASIEGVEAEAKRLDNQISRRRRCSDLRLCYDPGKEAEKKTGVVDALQIDRSRMPSGMIASIWLSYYGMGGIGKTALMKEVVKRLKTDELFNKVVVVILS